MKLTESENVANLVLSANLLNVDVKCLKDVIENDEHFKLMLENVVDSGEFVEDQYSDFEVKSLVDEFIASVS